MSKDIKKALEHCVEWKCDNCPNGDDLGSGEIVCRGRLLPQVLEYVADLEAKLEQYEKFMKDNEWDSIEEMQKTLNECEKKYFDMQQLAEKEKEIDERMEAFEKSCQEYYNSNEYKTDFAIEQLEEKKEKLYFELLFTRLQWIHKKADEFREEKERFGGIEDMALDSVWRVLDLQKHECCEYEEMVELEEGIETIAEDKLLRDIEHDLGVKVTRTENEIFDDIKKINQQINELNEGK